MRVECRVDRLAQYYVHGPERVELLIPAKHADALEFHGAGPHPIRLEAFGDEFAARVRKHPSIGHYYICPDLRAIHRAEGSVGIERSLADLLSRLPWYKPTGTRADDQSVYFDVTGRLWRMLP